MILHIQPAPKEPVAEADQQVNAIPEFTNDFTSEGSEFLDDAIRTKDQPYLYTEESISAGSPEGLL